MAEKAEQLGVNVAQENLKNFNNLSFMLQQVDSQRIGFCYDCCHHYKYYPSFDLLSMYGSRLVALHLHDYNGNTLHQLPFDGTIDWPAAMKKLADTGYSGATAIEAMNWSYKELEDEEFFIQSI
ncbi:sugar phosphate isomerase/epimerase family protein [Ruminiclostridium herbifermentans]|uniref:sugar phosphate isomerase/epimerase family protein n=1 Tax=Ruminiclostridium herbifermentans TaxID=2488810 RepID=UPI001FD3221F|nr:TIM barrel protein [Ruminiclostridium herbifermentans]